MPKTKLSPTIENYLSIVFVLERDGEPVVGARLAEILGVTPPTVTNTLKRMARDGLVVLDEPKGPRLTKRGLEKAKSVMRRHMLTEWMLTPMLSWSKVHSQAHEIEHAISEEVEAALIARLQDPSLCPHGNPLPGFEEVVADWTPLTEVPIGKQVIIRRIHELAEETPGLLAFLEEKGIIPGQKALVAEVLPFNQTITLHIAEGKEVSLGISTGRNVFVELDNPID